MKALLIMDEVSQLHWTILKSTLLILSLLPVSQTALSLWQTTQGSSQIIIDFFVISLLSTWFMICFLSALKTSVWTHKNIRTQYERIVVKGYRYLPMLFLSSLVAYLSAQIGILL